MDFYSFCRSSVSGSVRRQLFIFLSCYLCLAVCIYVRVRRERSRYFVYIISAHLWWNYIFVFIKLNYFFGNRIWKANYSKYRIRCYFCLNDFEIPYSIGIFKHLKNARGLFIYQIQLNLVMKLFMKIYRSFLEPVCFDDLVVYTFISLFIYIF